MLMAGTTEGVFALDGGRTSRVLEARDVRDLITIDGRLFAGTKNGLFFSDDDGRAWSEPRIEDHEIWTIRSAPDGTIYAGTAPAGLWRSTDRGDTWEANEVFAALPESDQWCVPLDPPQPSRARALVIDQNNPDRIWVGVEVGGVARTTDGGETWLVDLPGDNPDLHMMVAHPEQADTLFVSTGYGRFDHIAEEIEGNAGVFRSDDLGQSWQYAWKGITPRYSRPMCLDQRSPHSLTVASAPTAFSDHSNADGALAVLLRSDDLGKSWRSLGDEAHSPSAANLHGIMVDPDAVGGVIVGTDTGEVWQVSRDAQWELLANGLPKVWSLAPMP
jgi:photosystem II stability/assembly factor-like uncharacterized protein